MSTKHLATGSAFPPLKPDVMRIYSMVFCPQSQRTRLALAHKQIPCEEVNINLKSKPDWFLEKTPRGMVPVLEKNGQIVYESVICNQYLDDLYPDQVPLYPKDPYQKARAKLLMEDFDKIVSLMYKLVARKLSDEELKEAPNSLHNQLDKFEKELPSKFFGGDSPGALDLHMWPHMERACWLEIVDIEMLPAARFPKLTQYVKDMMETKAVKSTMTSVEHHKAFIRGNNAGKPDYDMDQTKPAPQ